ncbi:MAG: GAF domain-containing protein [Cyanobacteria bacterium P01_E01_bin.35]
MLDNTGLVWDLQQANQVAQSFSTSLDLEEISCLATDGLIKYFDCAFARIWLVEPDGKMLRLVASSGLYTHTDGSFSRIPMGAFKIGRIAQNRVSLLSNNLAHESWVRDPEWAIANKIKSFAGYPLVHSDKVIGVLAVFGHNPMRSDFLEVLLSLSTTLTVALEIASLHQQAQLDSQATKPITLAELSLSDALAHLLGQTKLTVMGTERCLSLSQIQLFLKVAEVLKTLDCSYCRLTYEVDAVSMIAIASAFPAIPHDQPEWEQVVFGSLFSLASCCGGILKVNTEASIKAVQISLDFPAPVILPELPLRIQCYSPLLQTGFSQLACSAGLKVSAGEDFQVPLLTDMTALMSTSNHIIWVNNNSKIVPEGAKAQIDLATTSSQLREVVATVLKGNTWGLENCPPQQQLLSHREQEVIALLAKGLRDRDIAERLYISDSTVKFHINNILDKLEAKTRLQALYNLMSVKGLEL